MSYPWPQGHRFAFSLVIAVEDADTLGPPVAGASATDLQYGLRAGFPRIADLLIEYPVKGTFLLDPELLERESLLGEFIQQRAHEAAVHAHLPGEVSDRSAWLRLASERVERASGKPPAGWRSRGAATTGLHQLLIEGGFRYEMDDRSDDEPSWHAFGDQRLISLPLATDCSDQRFLDAPALTPDAWLQYAIDTFDVLYAESENAPRMMSLLVHAHIIGRPGRITALEQILQYASSKDDVLMATRADIAEHFAAQANFPD